MDMNKAMEKTDAPSKNVDSVEKSFENDNPLAGNGDVVINQNEVSKRIEDENVLDKMAGCPIEGRNGHWSGERGNSDWIPDDDYVPTGQHTNPKGLTWKQIKEKYGIDKIPFKDGEPDFSRISKATVKIDNFTDKRTGKGGNFDQADMRLMKQNGMSKEELIAFKENYTWHESSDRKTLQLVPTIIHGNVSHNGGVSQFKENK